MMEKTLMLVSPRKPSTGNHVTVDRIEKALSSFGFRIVRFDSEVSACYDSSSSSSATSSSSFASSECESGSSSLTIPSVTSFSKMWLRSSSNSCWPSPELILTRQRLRKEIKKEKVDAIIGIHALHSGKLFLLDDNESPSSSPSFKVDVCGIPYAIVFGGTDINEAVHLPFELDLMTTIVTHATFLVGFHSGIVEKCITTWPQTSEKARCIPPSVKVHRPTLYSSSSSSSSSFTSTFRDRLGISNSREEASLFVLPCGIRPVKDPLFLVEKFSEWHLRNKAENEEMKEKGFPLPLPYLLVIGPTLDRDYSASFFEKLQFLGKDSSTFPGILYHEAISQEDLHNLLFSESDGLVNSSISEGLSNVILESMFLEVPVFARKNEGNSSVVLQNETGILFETPEEFVEGALELIPGNGSRTLRTIDKKGQEEGEGLRHRMVKNAREFVERHHSLETEAQLYCDLVVEMIRKKVTN